MSEPFLSATHSRSAGKTQAPPLRFELTGTPGQIGWAELIRTAVDAEFTRVARAFAAVAENQNDSDRSNTSAILAILEEKRAQVLANQHAGYYIRDWGEMRDQVRQSIFLDPRYQLIKARRAAGTLWLDRD